MRADAASNAAAEHRRFLPQARSWRVLLGLCATCLVVANLGLFLLAVPSMYRMLYTAPPEVKASIQRAGLSPASYALFPTVLNAAFSLLCLGVAVVIVRRAANNGFAQVVALCLVQFGAMSVPFAVALRARYPVLAPVGEVSALLSWSALILLMHLLPNGRFVPPWSRSIALLAIAGLATALLMGSSLAQPDSDLVGVCILGGVVSGALGQIYRYRRRSTAVERQQMKWIMFGIGAAALAQTAFVLLYPFNWSPVPAAFRDTPYGLFSVGSFGIALAYMLIPLTIGVAVLRYRLWDIDPIIQRTLVYALLTACVIGLYVLIVGYLGALFRAGNSPVVALVATGIVAVAFQPLRAFVQRLINRLLYGERDEPYRVISRLGQRLEGAIAMDALLPTIVQTVRDALKLPYAEITVERDGQSVTAAASGTPPAESLAVPLVHYGATIGQLRLAPRSSGETFSAADRRLLGDLARQASVAVHAMLLHQQTVQLVADVQQSRERIVTAREEERRRLRRDLHDGLGPQLASLTLKVDAARDEIAYDPATAAAMLHDVKSDLQFAIMDVRRVVYALRPPALDELGLIGAVRVQLERSTHGGLRLVVDMADDLPRLSAAVEAAAYRIIMEAVTNVQRHAQAQSCRVRVVAHAALEIEVVDDGQGLPDDMEAGVGLLSMRERAQEVGGSCTITGNPPRGTVVRATLPLKAGP